MKKIIFALSLLVGSNSYAINPDYEYIDFLKNYEKLSNENDPKGLELYADDAKIIGKRTGADGIEYTMTMTGKKLKEMFMENVETIKKMNYTSKFNDIKVIRDKNSAKIMASKYSNKDCFTDSDYYLLVSRRPDKKLYITEESFKTSPENLCKTGIKDDLALQLSLGANIRRKDLPIKIDRDTVLENIEAKDKELIMTYRLIHLTEENLPVHLVESQIVPDIIQSVCKETGMKKLLDQGATISLKYNYQDYRQITEIKMTKQDCSI